MMPQTASLKITKLSFKEIVVEKSVQVVPELCPALLICLKKEIQIMKKKKRSVLWNNKEFYYDILLCVSVRNRPTTV